MSLAKLADLCGGRSAMSVPTANVTPQRTIELRTAAAQVCDCTNVSGQNSQNKKQLLEIALESG
jgi:hypothetical protein